MGAQRGNTQGLRDRQARHLIRPQPCSWEAAVKRPVFLTRKLRVSKIPGGTHSPSGDEWKGRVYSLSLWLQMLLWLIPRCLPIEAVRARWGHPLRRGPCPWTPSEAAAIPGCAQRELQASCCHDRAERGGRGSACDGDASTRGMVPQTSTGSLVLSDVFVLSFHRGGLPSPGVLGDLCHQNAQSIPTPRGCEKLFSPTCSNT